MLTTTLSEKTTAKIAALDSKANQHVGWEANRLAEWLNVLTVTGQVEIGWREACGSTDSTQKVYREWLKVLKLLAKEGVTLTEENVKHPNRYAQNNGGWWKSIIYRINQA